MGLTSRVSCRDTWHRLWCPGVPNRRPRTIRQPHRVQRWHTPRLLRLTVAIPPSFFRSDVPYPYNTAARSLPHCCVARISEGASSLQPVTAVAALATAVASVGAFAAGATRVSGAFFTEVPSLRNSSVAALNRRAACHSVPGAGVNGALSTTFRATHNTHVMHLVRCSSSLLRNVLGQQLFCSSLPFAPTGRLLQAYLGRYSSGSYPNSMGKLNGDAPGRITSGTHRRTTRSYCKGRIACTCSSYMIRPNSSRAGDDSRVSGRRGFGTSLRDAGSNLRRCRDNGKKDDSTKTEDAVRCDGQRGKSQMDSTGKGTNGSANGKDKEHKSQRSRKARARAAAGTICVAPMYLHDGQPEEGDVVNEEGLRLRTYLWRPCHCNAILRGHQQRQEPMEEAASTAATPTAVTLDASSAIRAGDSGVPGVPSLAQHVYEKKREGDRELGWTGELVEKAGAASKDPLVCCSACEGRVRGVVLIVHGFGEHCRGQFLAKPLGQLSSTITIATNNSSSSTTSTEEGSSSNKGARSDTPGVHGADNKSGGAASPYHKTGCVGGSSSTARGERSTNCESSIKESEKLQNAEDGAVGERTEEGSLPVNTQLHYKSSWIESLNKEGYLVVGYDFQGHGMSEGWRGLRCCVRDMDDYARDVLLLLRLTQLRFLGSSAATAASSNKLPFYVVSVSMGAWSTARALQLAADPNECQALVPLIEAATTAARRTTTAAGMSSSLAQTTCSEAPDAEPVAAMGQKPTQARTITESAKPRAATTAEKNLAWGLLRSCLSPTLASDTCTTTAVHGAEKDESELEGVSRSGKRAEAVSPFLRPLKPLNQGTSLEEQLLCNSWSRTASVSTRGTLGRNSESSIDDTGSSPSRSTHVSVGSNADEIINDSSYNSIYSGMQSDGEWITCHTQSSATCGINTQTCSDKTGAREHVDIKWDFATLARAPLDLEGVVLISPMFDVERRKKELKWDILRLLVLPVAFFFPTFPMTFQTLNLRRRLLRDRQSPTIVDPTGTPQQLGKKQSGDSSTSDKASSGGGALHASVPASPVPASHAIERPALLAHLLSSLQPRSSEPIRSDTEELQHGSSKPQRSKSSDNARQESRSLQQQCNNETVDNTSTLETNCFRLLRDVYLRDPLTYKGAPPGGFVVPLMRSADSVLLPQQMEKITNRTTRRLLVIHNAEDPVCDYRGAFLFCQRLLQRGMIAASPALPGGRTNAAACTAHASPATAAAGAVDGFAREVSNGASPAEVDWELVLLNAREALENAKLRKQQLHRPAGTMSRSAPAAAAGATALDAKMPAPGTSRRRKAITVESFSFSAVAAAIAASPQANLWTSRQGRARLLASLLHEQQQQQHRDQERRADEQACPASQGSSRTAGRAETTGAYCSSENVALRRGKTSNTAERLPYVAHSMCGSATAEQQEGAPRLQRRGSSDQRLQLIEGIGEVQHNLTNEPGAADLYNVLKEWMHAPSEPRHV